ncbi:hypothetical protein ACFQ6N_22025 [Kitasatospora sp. NPDC056446]|uniref:hypothetical protein n=1 Tax=Kitasatospora sp. NPDC056446 TaxID=3345819 RepID=UPI0036B1CD15
MAAEDRSAEDRSAEDGSAGRGRGGDGSAGRGSAGRAGDRFEEELVVRLGTRARAVGGSPPLAELRRAGRRRARSRLVLRSVAGAAVFALGVGALAQWGGNGTGAVRGSAQVVGGGSLSPSPGTGSRPPVPHVSPGRSSSSAADTAGPLLVCPSGPASLRLPTWEEAVASATTSSLPPSGPPPGLPTTPPAVPSTGASTSGGPDDPDPVRVAADIRRLGAEKYPDHYFGVCDDLMTHQVYVMRAPGSDLDPVLLDTVRHPGVRIGFVDVPGSRKHYQALVRRITVEDGGYWAARGVTIPEVRISEDGAGVVVYTEQAAAVKADVLARYGSEVIEVRPTGRPG